MKQIISHANKSVSYIEKGKDLRSEEQYFDQLVRDIQDRVNSLTYHIPLISDIEEKKELVELIENIYNEFQRFDKVYIDKYVQKQNAYKDSIKKCQDISDLTASSIYPISSTLTNGSLSDNLLNFSNRLMALTNIVAKCCKWEKKRRLKKTENNIADFNRITFRIP